MVPAGVLQRAMLKCAEARNDEEKRILDLSDREVMGSGAAELSLRLRMGVTFFLARSFFAGVPIMVTGRRGRPGRGTEGRGCVMADRIAIKRVYDPPSARDGRRILVDRLWPRGISKQSAQIDLWLKEIAPSSELRTWFAHDTDKWKEFARRYRAELKGKADLLQKLRDEAGRGMVTLLFGAKDSEHNNAVVLRDLLVKGERDRHEKTGR